jgi:hypothetical protein
MTHRGTNLHRTRCSGHGRPTSIRTRPGGWGRLSTARVPTPGSLKSFAVAHTVRPRASVAEVRESGGVGSPEGRRT